MKVTATVQDLINPGKADDYFDIKGVSALSFIDTGFDSTVAWWLSECSRLVYRRNGVSPERSELWQRGYLTEDKVFFDQKTQTQAVLASSESGQFNILVFRGSSEYANWETNFTALQVDSGSGIAVHQGFLTALDSIWTGLIDILDQQTKPLMITGHSLGGALAVLCLSRVWKRWNTPVICYTFGAPRVGNSGFSDMLTSTSNFRVVNAIDIVPQLPFDFGSVKYAHAGQVCYIDKTGKLHSDWSELRVLAELRKHVRQFKNVDSFHTLMTLMKTQPFELPSVLADHAPVAYSRRLQQLYAS